MIYRFIDNQGTFRVKDPHKYNLYFPLTNQDGSLLSSISPNLSGDVKKDNEHFLMAPVSIEDLRSNLLCRREFFLKTGGRSLRLSCAYQDTLEAGLLYHKIIKRIGALEIEILTFIPYDCATEITRISVRNKGNKEIKITPTSFIPLYGRSEKCLRDHRHVSSLLNRVYLDTYGILLKPTMVFDEKGHKVNEVIYYALGFEGQKIAPVGQFPTLDYFFGESDVTGPDAIEKKVKPASKKLPEFDGKESCAAFRFKEKTLKKNNTAEYFLFIGIDTAQENIQNTFIRFDRPEKIQKSLEETKKYWLKHLSALEFDFQDKNYNNWLLWVKLQPTLRKLFGCSFLPHFDYGKGGRGWRDLWQDALTLLLTQAGPGARSFILNNFKGVRVDGSNATIITKDGEFISDRNRISRVWMDHGIWPYLTLRLYLNKTADIDILLEEDVYFQDHQLRRAREVNRDFHHQSYILHTKDGEVYRGSILEHILVQNLVQFFNVGRHNIIRLENADWNDGLDMAPDHGESVTFSFMYAHNLADLCGFLEKLKEKVGKVNILAELTFLLDAAGNSTQYNDYSYKHKRLDEYLSRVKNISGDKKEIILEDLIADLKAKSGHLFKWLREKEWLKEGFFNGYYDNKGNRVEGKTAGQNIRMLLPSQVFAIMSGGADSRQIKRAWASIKKYLQDKQLGGFRLNTNFNSHHNLDLGRAFGFSYGDKENGAFFSHMVVMLANALYGRGFISEGFEAFDSIYKMALNDRGKIYPLIPEYFNNEGRGLYLYLTGSASWYIYTLLEEVLGIKFNFGNICLEPKLTRSNFISKEIKVKLSLRDNPVEVVFTREVSKDVYRVQDVYVGDKKQILSKNNRYILKREDLNNKENLIKVRLG